MSPAESIAAPLCVAITTRGDLSPAASRVLIWMLGASIVTQSFPIELSIHEIVSGIRESRRKKSERSVPGTGANRSTVTAGIDSALQAGYLVREEGSIRPGGYVAYKYTIRVPK